MPIYEFKCLKCNEFFEIISTKSNENNQLKCPKCSSEYFERVVSKTNYSMSSQSSCSNNNPGKQTRHCSSGSCTTYTIPGLNKN